LETSAFVQDALSSESRHVHIAIVFLPFGWSQTSLNKGPPDSIIFPIGGYCKAVFLPLRIQF
jgi:hypothetical protein